VVRVLLRQVQAVREVAAAVNDSTTAANSESVGIAAMIAIAEIPMIDLPQPPTRSTVVVFDSTTKVKVERTFLWSAQT